MSKLSVFRKANGVSQGELAAYLGVTQGFVSQIERGNRPLPDELLAKILAKGTWDCSMLQDAHSISANASHNSKASVSISAPRGDSAAEVASLKRELEILREQLAEEKKRSEQYWDMIQRLTK